MHTVGKFIESYRNEKDELLAVFSIENEEILSKLSKNPLQIDFNELEDKRGIQANKYFWKLVSEIGTKIGCSNDAVYIMQLNKYGVFYDIALAPEALEEGLKGMKGIFRHVQDRGIQNGMHLIRCFVGSSHYSKSEMSRLINGTVQDAKDLGIETWSSEEIKHLISCWSGKK